MEKNCGEQRVTRCCADALVVVVVVVVEVLVKPYACEPMRVSLVDQH
jgi:hypothetical protein